MGFRPTDDVKGVGLDWIGLRLGIVGCNGSRIQIFAELLIAR